MMKNNIFDTIATLTWANESCSYDVIVEKHDTAYSRMLEIELMEDHDIYNDSDDSYTLKFKEKACFSFLFGDSFDEYEFDRNILRIEYKILRVKGGRETTLTERAVRTYVKKVCKMFGQKARFKKDRIVLSDIGNKYYTLAVLTMIRLVYEYYRSTIIAPHFKYVRSARNWKTFSDMLEAYKKIAPKCSYGTGHAPAPERVKVKTLSDFMYAVDNNEKCVNDLFY